MVKVMPLKMPCMQDIRRANVLELLQPALLQTSARVFVFHLGGILQQSWQENLLELEANLARSTAQWKLVIGHHPVRRNNRPDNNMDMLPTLEPILEKYGVQAYFCGHEHNLQYIHRQNSSVHYVITGGGSLTDYSPIVHFDNGGSQFQYWGSGEQTPWLVQSKCSLQHRSEDIVLESSHLWSRHMHEIMFEQLSSQLQLLRTPYTVFYGHGKCMCCLGCVPCLDIPAVVPI